MRRTAGRRQRDQNGRVARRERAGAEARGRIGNLEDVEREGEEGLRGDLADGAIIPGRSRTWVMVPGMVRGGVLYVSEAGEGVQDGEEREQSRAEDAHSGTSASATGLIPEKSWEHHEVAGVARVDRCIGLSQ